MSTESIKTEGLYYTVIDGTFRRRVKEGTPGATIREYETKDGGKGVKHEMVIDTLEGYIEDMQINDGDYGRQLNVKLDPNADGVNPMVQFSVETTYGEDVLKKLPRVDFSLPVRFRPYAFTDQDGREVRGVELKQGEKSHKNYFWDPDNKKPLHDFPIPQGDVDSYSKDDWKIHFLNVRKFLLAYFAENVVPKMNKEAGKRADEPAVRNYPDAEEIDPDNIPF